MSLSFLPIDSHLPSIAAFLMEGHNVVLSAEAGAGKTTRVPRALLDHGMLETCECWVLEPRRLAARMAAFRVAEELGEALGQRVGYAVRFEQKCSPQTKIRFVTEGLLLRRLQSDPDLKGIGFVILDEFHERHLQTDMALALLRRLQKDRRPDLRILAMSATMEAGPVAAFLGAKVVQSHGRNHPVDIRYLPKPDDRPLAEKVKGAVEALAQEKWPGHILVFLPGAREILDCERLLRPGAEQSGCRLFTLHGSLSLDVQRQAVAPSSERKIILSTNVAESSLTIDGVSCVVDCGLGRESQYSAWSGLSSLNTARISQARCLQRAGRAGRQGPGVCVRLYTENEYNLRPAHDLPEVFRADLSETLLRLHDLGIDTHLPSKPSMALTATARALACPVRRPWRTIPIRNTLRLKANRYGSPASLCWFAPPSPSSLEAADKLLMRLQALDSHGRLTQEGKKMAELPLHPRLARLVISGRALGIGDLAIVASALIESGDLKTNLRLERRAGGGHALDSDLWSRLDDYFEVASAGFAPGAIRAAGLDSAVVRQAHQAVKVLQGREKNVSIPTAEEEEKLLQALLSAYPDRLAKAGGLATFSLLGGGGARLGPSSRVKADLIVAIEAEERRGNGAEVLISVAARVEPEWLLDVAPDAIQEQAEWMFNEQAGRVERIHRVYFEDLCIEERRGGADLYDPRTAEALAEAAGRKFTSDALDTLLARVAFLAARRPELNLDIAALKMALLQEACKGRRTLKELEDVDWKSQLQGLWNQETFRVLESWVPEQVSLPKRKVKVHYDSEAPWIESRLQDFLGMKQGPRIANGAVPLVLHLLAPNFRAVQVTTDLEGFWKRAYQELRPQLSRRYPRHAWPEDPGA